MCNPWGSLHDSVGASSPAITRLLTTAPVSYAMVLAGCDRFPDPESAIAMEPNKIPTINRKKCLVFTDQDLFAGSPPVIIMCKNNIPLQGFKMQFNGCNGAALLCVSNHILILQAKGRPDKSGRPF
jgi:hypothetical protein